MVVSFTSDRTGVEVRVRLSKKAIRMAHRTLLPVGATLLSWILSSNVFHQVIGR